LNETRGKEISEEIEIVGLFFLLIGIGMPVFLFMWLMRMTEPDQINILTFTQNIIASSLVGILTLLIGVVVLLSMYADSLVG
jgi:hypothetical protein